MGLENRTYRIEDGQWIEGTWRPIFIQNDIHYLAHLTVYADGMIDCWGLRTFEEFRQEVRRGFIATRLPDGVRVSAFRLATWIFRDVRSHLTARDLVREVADEIQRLQHQPTWADLCRAAVEEYRQQPDETRRWAVRDAYLAVPEEDRQFILQDMDYRDRPLVDLITPIGEWAEYRGSSYVVTAEDHQLALDYFNERAENDVQLADLRRREHLDVPDGAITVVNQVWQEDLQRKRPGLVGLRAEYPRPVTYRGSEYPSVAHAYYALAVDDVQVRAEIVAAENIHRAGDLAHQAGLRKNWTSVHLAVMAELLRAKFAQHPDLAKILLQTGDGPIRYQWAGVSWWSLEQNGSNWLGRLLEVVRSELRLASTKL